MCVFLYICLFICVCACVCFVLDLAYSDWIILIWEFKKVSPVGIRNNIPTYSCFFCIDSQIIATIMPDPEAASKEVIKEYLFLSFPCGSPELAAGVAII